MLKILGDIQQSISIYESDTHNSMIFMITIITMIFMITMITMIFMITTITMIFMITKIRMNLAVSF